MTEPETDVIIRDTGEQGYIWEPRSEKAKS
jgi:hypothetical protein